MGDKSAIEWTATFNSDGTVAPGSSWNPIRGVKGRWSCIKTSPGCANCYAERFNVRLGGPAYRVGADQLRLDEKVLMDPIRWKRPRKIFVCSMTDLFEERVPDDWLFTLFGVMAVARHQTFMVLTKHAQRMQRFTTEAGQLDNIEHEAEQLTGYKRSFMEMEWPLPNLILMVSAENQRYADERIPFLLQTPAAVRGVSLEPLLGPIDLDRWFWRKVMEHEFPGVCKSEGFERTNALQWVIVGGESGGPPERALVEREWYVGPDDLTHSRWKPKAEALNWVRDICDQCVAAGVPFFFKQFGGPTPKSGGRILDGRTWDEMPGVRAA